MLFHIGMSDKEVLKTIHVIFVNKQLVTKDQTSESIKDEIKCKVISLNQSHGEIQLHFFLKFVHLSLCHTSRLVT